MDDLELRMRARRNIRLYPLLKVFNKRVFLPIIPIYYIDYVGFSIPQIGMLAALFALINIAFNMPAGYFADRFGRVASLKISGIALVISTIFYAGVTTKTGIIIGIGFEAIGFAFLAGAGESLVHDSLEVLKRQKEYSKILSRAQSIALLINAALVAVVPLSYAIDPRLPFAIGTIAFGIMLATIFLMNDVIAHTPKVRVKKTGLSAMIRILHKNLTLFIAVVFFGIVAAMYFSFDIVTIALREFGVSPEHLGWIFASASVAGAFIGLFVHKLKQLSLQAYMCVDITVLLFVYAAAYFGDLWVLIAAVVLTISFWRYRRIIYQDHLLERYKSSFKSTMLSAMNTTESMNGLWVPIVTTGIVGTFGVTQGFGILGISGLVVGLLFMAFMNRAFVTKT